MTKVESEYASCLVSLDKIKRCFFESRTETVDEGFDDLVESIKKYGVLQPIGVRPLKDGYELFAGDRRFRAARQAGLKVIPVVIRDLSDEDALVLQAIENLQRRGLSDAEKTRIVVEVGKFYDFDVWKIHERIGMSESWIRGYLPNQYKNQKMQEVRAQRSESQDNVTHSLTLSQDSLEVCEFDGADTSEPKLWENHVLCPLHYSQALEDPARFKRLFGFQQQEPVLGKSKALEVLEESDIQVKPEQCEMVEAVLQLLLDKGIQPVITNRKYSVTTVIHLLFPSRNLGICLDDKNNVLLEKDNVVREWLRKHHGMRVLSIIYGNRNKGEVERIVNEIVREVKKD